MKKLILLSILSSGIFFKIEKAAASWSTFWKSCYQKLSASPFSKPDRWFSPQFKSKGAAERWLYSMLPNALSKRERDLLTEWPRQDHSLRSNAILRSDQLATRGTETIIDSSQVNFKLSDILSTFEGIHSRNRSDRRVTAYRAIGSVALAKDLNVGDSYTDAGLSNLSLDQTTAISQGKNRAKKDGSYVLLSFDIPKGYPLTPTLAHYPYQDSTGQQNLVSVELEMTLPPNSQAVVTNRYHNSDGTLVLELTLIPR